MRTATEKKRKNRLAPRDKADLTPLEKAQKTHEESMAKLGEQVFYWPPGHERGGLPVPAVACSDSGPGGVLTLQPVTHRQPVRGVHHSDSEILTTSHIAARRGFWSKERLDLKPKTTGK